MSAEIRAGNKSCAHNFAEIFRKNDYLLKKIIYFVGVISIFVTGLLFVLLCDVKLSCESTWLVGAIFLAFGGGVFAVLSAVFKEKLVLKYLFRGFAVALGLGFIGFLVGFYLNKASAFAFEKPKREANFAIFVVMMILSILTSICQIADLILEVTIKEE